MRPGLPGGREHIVEKRTRIVVPEWMILRDLCRFAPPMTVV